MGVVQHKCENLHYTKHCIEGTQSIQDGQVGRTHVSILNLIDTLTTK